MKDSSIFCGACSRTCSAFAASDPELRPQPDGIGTMYLLVPEPQGAPVPRSLRVINATEASQLPAREPVLICAPCSFDLQSGVNCPIVVFPVRRFLRNAQIHANASDFLEGLASRMTISLACLLQDFRAAVDMLTSRRDMGCRCGELHTGNMLRELPIVASPIATLSPGIISVESMSPEPEAKEQDELADMLQEMQLSDATQKSPGPKRPRVE